MVLPFGKIMAAISAVSIFSRFEEGRSWVQIRIYQILMSFSVILSFDGLHPKSRQAKRLLPFQMKTSSLVIPEGNALKRPLLQQLHVQCWELPGGRWLLEVRRSTAKFGFMLFVTPVLLDQRSLLLPKQRRWRAKVGVHNPLSFDVPVSMSLFCQS